MFCDWSPFIFGFSQFIILFLPPPVHFKWSTLWTNFIRNINSIHSKLSFSKYTLFKHHGMFLRKVLAGHLSRAGLSEVPWAQTGLKAPEITDLEEAVFQLGPPSGLGPGKPMC